MGVIAIKKDLTNVANSLNTIVNDCETVIQTVSQSTDLTINNVYYPCSKLNEDGKQTQQLLKRSYKDIMNGLELLLKDLANELLTLENTLNTARKDSKKIKDNAKILYELVLFDISIEGFLEYDFSIEKNIMPYLVSIEELKKSAKEVQQKCIYWNNQIIIKRR